ncbi:MAG: large-conductance mechanosensitive channel protein MscL [Thiothrix sp.]|uniref:large-conductance mechanosensitive channel protein MscL n=1 Tax=Thiothrix sp. TaxID=1032 RepID=UPI00262A3C89|nr:large-conductance mechanosensitive channel protein MscL [Thiothrix sp.]MDD5392986.1 large-conductance mechanosensitive channel protein MscL [Thiothrix sp.]
MSFISEFKEFAMKGNVVDLAVGVIIGGAFGKIVTSFVGDVVMPVIGTLVGGVNFSDLAIVLQQAQGEAPAVLLKYGAFLQTVFDFLIIALAIFLAIKAMNKFKRKEEAAAPAAPSAEAVLLSEIRDLLQHK